MSEAEFLVREQRINNDYRDGMISLEQKKEALINLIKKWEESNDDPASDRAS